MRATGYTLQRSSCLCRGEIQPQRAGRLLPALLAGPLPAIESEDPGPAGFAGSLIVAEFGSLAEARAWADADPYVAANVYRGVEIHPFRRVLP